ncbi:Uncharacterised protein [Mycobacteroides abscessus subsp. abscessus]|nr:Uncharacterised protein [Mycobacteroides abscessus subsp. abscessus]
MRPLSAVTSAVSVARAQICLSSWEVPRSEAPCGSLPVAITSAAVKSKSNDMSCVSAAT